MRNEPVALSRFAPRRSLQGSRFEPLIEQRFKRRNVYRHHKCRVDAAPLSHPFERFVIPAFVQRNHARTRKLLRRREHRFEIAQAIAKVGLKMKIRDDDIGFEGTHQRYRLAGIPGNCDLVSQRTIALRQLAMIEAHN